MSAHILIIDDEKGIRLAAAGILEDEGYSVKGAADAQEATQALAEHAPDLIILDVWLQGSAQDGLEILADIKGHHPDIPIVMISGHGTIETAVIAIKRGAYDFIEKPFAADRLLLVVRRALEAASLKRENAALRQATTVSCEIIGQSCAMQTLRTLIARVARAGSRVLITGEAGTGKTIVARALHAASSQNKGPFVALSCSGADTACLVHAVSQAAGGTLFLDAVSDLSASAQSGLIALLQDKDISARIIAATLKGIEGAPDFRQDLYYRLAVVPIVVPALRERPEDIVPLSCSFVDDIAHTQGLPHKIFLPSAFAALERYTWPGNIRQLRNAIEWTLIMHSGNTKEDLGPEHLPPEVLGILPQDHSTDLPGSIMALPLREAREKFERAYLDGQMTRFGGSVTRTACFIGMERSALHRKVKSLGLGTEG